MAYLGKDEFIVNTNQIDTKEKNTKEVLVGIKNEILELKGEYGILFSEAYTYQKVIDILDRKLEDISEKERYYRGFGYKDLGGGV